MKKLLFIFCLLFCMSCKCQVVSSSIGDITDIMLLDPICDDEELVGDHYIWGYVVIDSTACNKDMSNGISSIINNPDYIYSLDEDTVCYCEFLPDICIRCENVDVFIEFSTYSILYKFCDGSGADDYYLNIEGYSRLLDYCIELFPGDDILKEYKKKLENIK